MESIKMWLAGSRQYLAGVKLYRQFGTDKLLMRSFEERESEFKKKKLIKALQELLEQTGKKKEAGRAVQQRQVKDAKGIEQINGWPKKMDDVLAALYSTWRPKFLSMQDLCTRLYDVAMAGEGNHLKEMEAGAMCFEIIRLDDECDKLYAARDFYMKNGRLPDQPSEVEIKADPAHQWRHYSNITRYVRHYRKKVQQDPANAQFQMQLKKYEDAVRQYREILKLV